MDISLFIKSICDIDESVDFICTNGACYKFAKFLQMYFPTSELYISDDKQHVIVKHENVFYDIGGARSGDGYTPMTKNEEGVCKEWSFHQKYYAGKECSYCGEIIT